MKFYYVYVLESETEPDRHYVGFTEDLKQRLKEHNNGKLPNTARYRPHRESAVRLANVFELGRKHERWCAAPPTPWRISSAHAFPDKVRALAFEKYLKSGSGREFARRHF